MSWYSASKGYNVDHSLRLEGFDDKRDFARECSEVCSCNINRCVNRATQVTSRVRIHEERDGQKLALTRDVDEGDFLCRISGELSDTKTETPDDNTFLLPKFVIVINHNTQIHIIDKKFLESIIFWLISNSYSRLS